MPRNKSGARAGRRQRRTKEPHRERATGLFKCVLVPTDLTERTVAAIEVACRIADGNGARVTVLHVIERINGLPERELTPFYRKLERRAQATMAAMTRRAPEGASIRPLIRYGRRAEEIVRAAKEEGADLLVLSSHRVNPAMSGRDWGSISYKVGILATCPVLLMK